LLKEKTGPVEEITVAGIKDEMIRAADFLIDGSFFVYGLILRSKP